MLPPSPILGLANVPIVETKFLELAMSLLDFSPRIPLGTFSILLAYLSIAANMDALRLRSILLKNLQSFNYNNFIFYLPLQVKSSTKLIIFMGLIDGITFIWIPLCQFERNKEYENDNFYN